MKTIAKQLFLVGLLAIGFALGRFSALRAFREKVGELSSAYTLGRLLPKSEDRLGASRAYSDSEAALADMDIIAWAPPTMPTPFVGDAPIPGTFGVATHNAMQFRADSDVVMPKPDGVFRIFLTGGSTAYGTGAPSQDQTIAAFLAEFIHADIAAGSGRRYELFTAACPAWTTTHERILIENRLSELAPDLVISLSGNNDVHWGRRGCDVLWFRTYADRYFFDLINGTLRAFGQPSMPKVIDRKKDEIAPATVATRLLKNVRLSAFALSEQGVHYLFVLQPTLAVSGKRLTGREQQMVSHQAYFRECYACVDSSLRGFAAENFTYVNLTDAFDGVDADDDIFVDSYHFGDKGNRIVARAIYAQIGKYLVP